MWEKLFVKEVFWRNTLYWNIGYIAICNYQKEKNLPVGNTILRHKTQKLEDRHIWLNEMQKF